MSVINKFTVLNMKCGGCVANARKAIEALDGVENAEVSLENAEAIVAGDVDPQAVIKAVTDAGYPAELKD